MISEQPSELVQERQSVDDPRAVRWTRDQIAAWCAAHGRRLALFLEPVPPPTRFPALLSRRKP